MVSSGRTESYLIERAVAGDADAYGELYSLHLDAIYRYIFFRIGDQQEAEDLTENVFLKAWEALPNYREFGNPFSSWLYRIAHNLVVDFHRKIKPVVYEADPQNDKDELVDDTANTLTTVIEAENLQILAKAISQLTTEQQQVIVLRFIEGLNHNEISKIIGKNEGTCRMIQHRALSALNRLLSVSYQPGDNG